MDVTQTYYTRRVEISLSESEFNSLTDALASGNVRDNKVVERLLSNRKRIDALNAYHRQHSNDLGV